MFRLILLILCCISSQASGYELAIVSMFKNEGPYLREWVEYHHRAGVEHFWLYNNESTDNWEDALKPYLDLGIVEVIYWPLPDGEIVWEPFQVYAFRDGIQNAVNKTKWLAIIDIDEFIVPMVDTKISECLDAHFSEASAVYINWRNFGTGGVFIPKGDPLISKLLACSEKIHPCNSVGKSIIRPECADIFCVWSPHQFFLKPGALYVNGNGKKMEFMGTDLPTDGKHYDQYIRINHYMLRDENFYQNNRLAKAMRGIGDLNLLLEHYDSFSLTQDTRIVEYINNFFGDLSQTIWRNE